MMQDSGALPGTRPQKGVTAMNLLIDVSPVA